MPPRSCCPKCNLAALGTDRLADILQWTDDVAPHYRTLRPALETKGVTIVPIDPMIFAHALAVNATFVSAYPTLVQMDILRIENWSGSSNSNDRKDCRPTIDLNCAPRE